MRCCCCWKNLAAFCHATELLHAACKDESFLKRASPLPCLFSNIFQKILVQHCNRQQQSCSFMDCSANMFSTRRPVTLHSSLPQSSRWSPAYTIAAAAVNSGGGVVVAAAYAVVVGCGGVFCAMLLQESRRIAILQCISQQQC